MKFPTLDSFLPSRARTLTPIQMEMALNLYSLRTLREWSKEILGRTFHTRQENISFLMHQYRKDYPAIRKEFGV